MNAIAKTIMQGHKQDLAFSIDIAGQDPNSLLLTNFQLTETLSELYFGTATLISRDLNIDLNACIDKLVTVRVHKKYDAVVRHFHGVVESMASLGNSGNVHWASYTITVAPTLHRLRHGSDARIFQKITVPDIVKTLLDEHGIEPYQFRLKDTRLEREYCVQYRETHLDFIERILAEEGIFYYWEHTESGAKLIFTDLIQLATPLDATPELEYNNRSGGMVKGEYINQFQWWEVVRPTGLTQRDYCFKNPPYRQHHHSSRSREGGEHAAYELYNAYGRYKEANSGERFTQYSLDAVRNDASLGYGSSNAMHLSAGHRFSLTEHDQERLNRKYLIVSVTHSGQQPQAAEEQAGAGGAGGTFYDNQFTVFAEGSISWRPPQKYKPLVDGPQIAHVVGPPGEEIYTDEHGRVKVHFPWDRYSKRDDKSSCWVRVSQAWAGATWGFVSIPRIGHEVIVDFLEGDPDQPIITGRTYHATNKVPYDLPANKTQTGLKSRSSPGGNGAHFNEIRFEDKKGQEQVYIHAEKNQDNIVENDETTEIGHDRTEHVGHDETITIDNDRTEKVGHDEKITIGNDRTEKVVSNESITIGKNRTEKVGVNESITIGKNRTERVGDNESITIGKNRSENVGDNESITIGKNRTEKVGKDESISIGKNRTESVGDNESINIGKNQTIQVGKNITIEAGDQIVIKTGKSSITMKKDGTIQISGKNITVKGSGKIDAKASKNITLKGQKILQN